MKRAFNRPKWTILFLACQIFLSACAFFVFTGDLSREGNQGPESVYDSGSRQIFSWRSDLYSFNISICQLDTSRLSAALCRFMAEIPDRDGPGTAVSKARWNVSNEGLFDNKDTDYYLNVTAEGVETLSRSFRIVRSIPSSPSSAVSNTVSPTIITIPKLPINSPTDTNNDK
ncbi:hypothetical protein V8F33_012704 [Rhypophila sp. PSN 637]